jgi:glyoxylase-like metal-dependent hydrolase (beta-lactamase superfamily II)
MRSIGAHLVLLTRVHISNIWLFRDDDGRRWLVDTGHPIERPLLARSLRAAGVDRLDGILLTHRHSDHAGNAAWLRDRFRCPVACHPDDAPYLDGRLAPPRLARGRAPAPLELLCRIEDRFPARCPVDEVYSPGRWRGDWEIVHAPGHTEGSSLLYHAPTRTLFSGDTLISGIPPLRLLERLSLAVDAFTPDPETCRAKVRDFLRALPPVRTLCAGHGPAVTRRVEEKLRRLA